MKFPIRIGERIRTVQVENGAECRVQMEGAEKPIEAVALGPDAYSILLDGRSYDVRVTSGPDGLLVSCGGLEFLASVQDPRAWRPASASSLETAGRQQVKAPMPGKVIRVLVAAGDSVQAHQGLVVVEAMKMQNEVRAPKAGTIEKVFVAEGQAVAAAQPLVTIA